MFMSDWSALMTPSRPPWTACVHFRNLYPIDVSQLSYPLSAVTLGIYPSALTTYLEVVYIQYV
jgi:hypothetical protein